MKAALPSRARAGVFCACLQFVLALASSVHPQRALPAEEPVLGYGWVNALPDVLFSEPVGVLAAPGETNRLFVVERRGRVMVIPDLQNPQPEVFLDLLANTDASNGEGGLLGMAFHPDYQNNGRFFLYRCAPGSPRRNRLAEFRRDPENPNRGLKDSEIIMINQADGVGYHNAGDLQFGADGYLYLSLGDEGPIGEDVPDGPQAIDKGFFGTIVRLDVDNRPGNLPPNPHPSVNPVYRVPHDNPFVGATNFNNRAVDPGEVRTEFYAVGLRNPWRFAFDPYTGKIICADVGAGYHEEINLIEPGGNYGWPFLEAARKAWWIDPRPDLEGTFIPPVHVYNHGYGEEEGHVIIGGRVYTGDALPALKGKYLFADNRTGKTWAIDPYATTPEPEWLTARKGIAAFGLDPRDGEMLMASVEEGHIYKLVYVAPEESTAPETLAETGVFESVESLVIRSNFVPYRINVPFWSDNALKQRWFFLNLDAGQIQYEPSSNWTFPAGGIWVKHFDLELTPGDPESRQRVETRFIVTTGKDVYGLTYSWENGTNATLVPPQGMNRTFLINEPGGPRSQVWRYPSWQECRSCHTPSGGYVLGFNSFQLNRETGEHGNMLEWLAASGYFSNPEEVDASTAPRLLHLADTNAPLQAKVRSWLHANCVQCHQPGGPGLVRWDARITTPLHAAGLLNARPSGRYQSYPIVTPGDPGRSMIHARPSTRWPAQMPPFATTVADTNTMALLAQWIRSLPTNGWTSANLGDSRMEGSVEQAGSRFVVSGSGEGLQANSFQFVYRPFVGYESISGLLVTNRSASLAAEGGLMIRSGIVPGASYAAVYRKGTEVIFQAAQADGAPKEVSRISHTGPVWLRLTRLENSVSALYKETPGGTWILLGSMPFGVAENALAGLFAAADAGGAHYNNAEFEQVEISSPSVAISWSATEELFRVTIQQVGAADPHIDFEVSEDLLTWSPASDSISTNSLPGGFFEFIYTSPLEASPQQFLRIRTGAEEAQ